MAAYRSAALGSRGQQLRHKTLAEEVYLTVAAYGV